MEHFLDVVARDGVFVLRLLAAMLLGGLVGMERQSRGREAGLRTNILVCLGSAAVIVAFQKLSSEFSVDADSVIRMDPARAAAGVITGIGFLGAGTIVKSNDFVRGLTTAASIWAVAAIGVTVGLGEYVIASVVTLLVLVALYVLHRLPFRGDRYASLELKWTGDFALLAEVTTQLEEQGAKIKNRSVIRQPKTENCEATLVLRLGKHESDMELFGRLQADARFDEVGWR
ncbi:MAG: MgtC/SapB family protein [Marinobacter sp.]|uniref:MgtC/SapB family protein n=1 Tax=Marinobacter sp. TaxID=50741 RepID=UPI003F967EE6